MSTADDDEIVAPPNLGSDSDEADQYAGLTARGLSSSPTALLMLDAALVVTFANDSAHALWGLGGSGAIGRPVSGLLTDSEQTDGFIKALQRDGRWSGELSAVGATGSQVELLANANAVDGEDDNLGGYLCMFFDVGDRRDELRRLEHGLQMFGIIGARAKFVMFEAIPERGLLRLIGSDPLFPLAEDEATRNSLEARLEMYIPEDRAMLVSVLDAIAAGKPHPGPVDARAVMPDGNVRWMRLDAYLASPPDEVPARIVGWTRDITEEKEALLELEKLEERYALAAAFGRMMVFELIPSEGKLIASGSNRLMPVSDEDWSTDSLEARFALFHPDDADDVREFVRSVAEGERDSDGMEARVPFPDGSTHWLRIELHAAERPEDGRVRIIGTARDITEKRVAEEALRDSEERLREVMEASGDFVWETDSDGRLTFISESIEQLIKQPADTLLGVYMWDIGRPLVSDKSQIDAVKEAFESKSSYQNLRIDFAMPDGRVMNWSNNGKPVFGADNSFLGYRGVSRDVTVLIKAEGQLRTSTERYALAANYGRMAAWEMYPDDGKILTDSNLMALLGQSDVEPTTDLSVLNDTIYPADREYVADALREVFEGRSDSFAIEHRMNMPDGSVEWRRDEGHVASKPGERLRIVGTSLDITGRRGAQEQLQQAQKMETVGQLSAGVAHDFNNLLAVVLGNIELVMEGLSDQPELRDLLEQAVTAGERGAELTQHLLAFSRRQTLYPEVTDLNAVIGDLLQLVERTIGREIEIAYRPDSDLRLAFIDRSQLESGILNLAINARDAMPNGGALTITAKNVTRPNQSGEAPSSNDFVCVEVVDTGMGMDEETLAGAFQPFFTTKGVGKGSGLGLSMVHGFAEQSGGHVELESTLGQGTSVKLYLPVSTEDRAVERSRAGDGLQRSGKGHTVLVVDDDEHVRAVVAKLVRSLGYEVTLGRDAKEALSVLDSSHAIALLLTDVVLGSGMDGVALAIEAKRRFPTLATLCMSGHAENDILDGYDEAAHLTILPKPFTKARLSEQIEEVLSGSSGAELPTA